MADAVLLRLCARGEALVAELMRLSEHVPAIFDLSQLKGAQRSAYAVVMPDFAYLRNSAFCEHKIESSADATARDEEIWASHGEVVCRFFSLFESIYKYIRDFARCVADLRDGVYIQQTVETILLDEEGKQLLCEVLYLYGVLLTMLDAKIDGAVRERLLVAFYRHKGAATIENIDDVCLLVKATGYSASAADRSGWPKRPAGYPEEYFARLTRKLMIPSSLIHMMIDRLRSEDMYSQIPSYPLPLHRSTALATQARMLYILLFFVPEVLQEQAHTMREIVDRHFADNWVIAYYMGNLVELCHAWEPYKAAKTALSNTTQPATIRALHEANAERMSGCRKMLQHYLTEGVLTEDYVLDNTPALLHCVRECNVALRWLMLHRRAKAKKLPKTALKEPEQVLLLLMNSAQLEYRLRKLVESLLAAKEEMWSGAKAQALSMLEELADYFSGERALTRVGPDKPLQQWFLNLAEQVRALSSSELAASGRKLYHLITALSEVEQFHQIESALQIQQFLAETRERLHRMMRVLNVRDSVRVTLAVVSDMSYAWELISDYSDLMRARIQRDPFCVMKLRATFLKLVSILDSPLNRINQANSPDLESVSQYYSSALVSYVRSILQVIPQDLFGVLREIVQLKTSELRELPVKVERVELREWAQLPARHRLAAATHRITVLTEGVLNMQTTLLGVIAVDPKELLNDGVERELVAQLIGAMQSAQQAFRGNNKPGDVEAALEGMSRQFEGVKLALEYISDYVKMNGLLLYRKGMQRVVGYFIEQECNSFLRRRPPRSRYLSASERPADGATNVVGLLVRQMLAAAASKRASYIPVDGGWFDSQGRPLLTERAFSLVAAALGRQGLHGVHRVLGFVCAALLTQLSREYTHSLSGGDGESGGGSGRGLRAVLERHAQAVAPLRSLPEGYAKRFSATTAAMSKLWSPLADAVSRVGTAQLLRLNAARRLHTCSLRASSLLHSTLQTANEAVLSDICAQIPDEYTELSGGAFDVETEPPAEHPTESTPTSLKAEQDASPAVRQSFSASSGEILGELASLLESAGICHPLRQVFIAGQPLPLLHHALALFTVSQLSKLSWSAPSASFAVASRSGAEQAVDGMPLVIGIATILAQGHPDARHDYIGALLQYVRAQVHLLFAKDPRASEVAPETAKVLRFLWIFCEATGEACDELQLYASACGVELM